MHDINPLGTTMHLRELERQAAPRVRAVPSRKPHGFGPFSICATAVAFLRRLNASSVRVRTQAH